MITSATITWIYTFVLNMNHSVRRPMLLLSGTRQDGQMWQIPTIDDDTVSTLDRIRAAPAMVI